MKVTGYFYSRHKIIAAARTGAGTVLLAPFIRPRIRPCRTCPHAAIAGKPYARASVLVYVPHGPDWACRGDAPGSLRKGAGCVFRRGPVPPDAAAGCSPTLLRWSFKWLRQDHLQHVPYHVLSRMRKRFCSSIFFRIPVSSSLSFLSVLRGSTMECLEAVFAFSGVVPFAAFAVRQFAVSSRVCCRVFLSRRIRLGMMFFLVFHDVGRWEGTLASGPLTWRRGLAGGFNLGSGSKGSLFMYAALAWERE